MVAFAPVPRSPDGAGPAVADLFGGVSDDDEQRTSGAGSLGKDGSLAADAALGLSTRGPREGQRAPATNGYSARGAAAGRGVDLPRRYDEPAERGALPRDFAAHAQPMGVAQVRPVLHPLRPQDLLPPARPRRWKDAQQSW